MTGSVASAGSDDAAEIYARSGIGHRVGFGRRPALVVVDLQNGFTDPACAVGGELDEVLTATAVLLDEARSAELPIAFTAVGFDQFERETSTWLRKMPGLAVLTKGSHWCEIDQRVSPGSREPVYLKRASSAFFGTPLLTFLTATQVDTLVIAGCVTSGCVRATAIDAVSYGFRPIVPAECVGDRAERPHETNLFDIDAKYADVVSLDSVIAAIRETATKGASAPVAR